MRCKACDNVMREQEVRINPKSGELEELCFKCLGVAYDSVTDQEVSSADFEDLGITASILDNNKETW